MDLVYQILSVLNGMGGFAYQWSQDPISLVNFRQSIKLWCNCFCRVHLFVKNANYASVCFVLQQANINLFLYLLVGSTLISLDITSSSNRSFVGRLSFVQYH